jgi:hypothetical protein
VRGQATQQAHRPFRRANCTPIGSKSWNALLKDIDTTRACKIDKKCVDEVKEVCSRYRFDYWIGLGERSQDGLSSNGSKRANGGRGGCLAQGVLLYFPSLMQPAATPTLADRGRLNHPPSCPDSAAPQLRCTVLRAPYCTSTLYAFTLQQQSRTTAHARRLACCCWWSRGRGAVLSRRRRKMLDLSFRHAGWACGFFAEPRSCLLALICRSATPYAQPPVLLVP